MKTQTLLSRLIAALSLCGLLASCELTPPGDPASGTTSFGTLASSNMQDYYYPHEAGWKYVYKNTIEVDPLFSGGGPTVTTVLSYDTLRTLGFYGSAPNGDSIFAAVISYRVASDYMGRMPMDLYYVPKNNDPEQGWVLDGPNPIEEAVAFTKPKPKPVSTDTILACLAGPIKKRIDPGYTGTTGAWQSDTLWYTAYRDSVVIWERAFINAPLKRARNIFLFDLKKSVQGWQYGAWEASTYWDVVDDDQWVTVGAGTFRSAKIKAYTDDNTTGVRLPITEHKWFAYTRGLCKQVDKWKSTNGTYSGSTQSNSNLKKWQNELTHELVSASK